MILSWRQHLIIIFFLQQNWKKKIIFSMVENTRIVKSDTPCLETDFSTAFLFLIINLWLGFVGLIIIISSLLQFDNDSILNNGWNPATIYFIVYQFSIVGRHLPLILLLPFLCLCHKGCFFLISWHPLNRKKHLNNWTPGKYRKRTVNEEVRISKYETLLHPHSWTSTSHPQLYRPKISPQHYQNS